MHKDLLKHSHYDWRIKNLKRLQDSTHRKNLIIHYSIMQIIPVYISQTTTDTKFPDILLTLTINLEFP